MPSSRRDFVRGALTLAAAGVAMLRDDALERVLAANAQEESRHPGEGGAGESYWTQIQQAFTIDRSLINLNNGGVCPSPRVVQDAMRRHLEFSNNAPAKTMWDVLNPEVETVRARLARAFGCSADEMAITRNASEALETCLFGFDLKPGDEVLTSELDYPRMIWTCQQRELREGIKLVQVPIPAPADDMGQYVEAFKRGITPRTKLMLISHVVFLTGQILPVRELCRLGRQHNIPVIVDGAHAFAHLPYKRDDLECDYYGVSLHKWTSAPHGTGFLSVRKERIASLWPLMASPQPLSDDIRKFEEIGTHPAANRLAISEALAFYQGIGPERKAARLRWLRDRWARRLMQDKRVRLYTKLDAEHSCAIGTFAIADMDHARLVEYLWKRHRIITVAILSPTVNGIRVTPNIYTMPDEIDLFCEAVEEVLAKGLPG